MLRPAKLAKATTAAPAAVARVTEAVLAAAAWKNSPALVAKPALKRVLAAKRAASAVAAPRALAEVRRAAAVQPAARAEAARVLAVMQAALQATPAPVVQRLALAAVMRVPAVAHQSVAATPVVAHQPVVARQPVVAHQPAVAALAARTTAAVAVPTTVVAAALTAAAPAATPPFESTTAVQVQAPPEGFQSRVEQALSSFNLPAVSARAKEQLIAYCELAVTWNQRVDLTAARSADELVDLLLADAFAISAARPGDQGERWFDVGSGIGAPGIPLALLAPVNMTLIEPRTKRVAFLRTAAGALGRPDITVSRSRSDEFLAASCDVAVSRATFPPPEWLKEGARLATRAVWLLLAKAGVPDLDDRSILADVTYSWPLTGAQRRAVCVTAKSSRDAIKT